MHYFILFLSLLSLPLRAQPTLAGLGPYRIGITTPDSLSRMGFNEQQQPRVKGTIALPCSHVRLFTADSIEVEGVMVVKLSLLFSNNQLFRITCAYNPKLQQVFTRQHGKGVSRPKSRLFFCGQDNQKAMTIWGETWVNGDIIALTLHATGYNADCQQEQADWLIIAGHSLSDLSSDCSLQESNLFSDEFDRLINEQ